MLSSPTTTRRFVDPVEGDLVVRTTDGHRFAGAVDAYVLSELATFSDLPSAQSRAAVVPMGSVGQPHIEVVGVDSPSAGRRQVGPPACRGGGGRGRRGSCRRLAVELQPANGTAAAASARAKAQLVRVARSARNGFSTTSADPLQSVYHSSSRPRSQMNGSPLRKNTVSSQP